MNKYYNGRKKYQDWLQKNPSELEKMLDLFPDSEFKRNQITKLCLNPNSKYSIKESDLTEINASNKEEQKEKLQQEELKLHEKNGKIRKITIIGEEENEEE